MANYRDFDALSSQQEPFVVKVQGREIEARRTLSARVALEAQRKARGNMSDNEALDFLVTLGESCFGANDWDHLMDNLGMGDITSLVEDLLVYYGLRDEEPDPKAEETQEVEESDSPTSLPTGENLTPTSNGFGLVPGSVTILDTSHGENSLAG